MRIAFLIFITIFLADCKKKAQPQPDSIAAVDTTSKATTPVTTTPTPPTTPVTTPPKTSSPQKYVSYLALGDSYTVGESVEKENSFPFQLHDVLSAYVVTQPLVIARTGWTSGDLIQAIEAGGYKGQTYDMVTLLIGVNDQYQGRDKEDYRNNFVYLVNTAIGFAKGNPKRVFVVSIPDYGVTPYANGQDAVIGPQIDTFNTINKTESDKFGVNYIDITPVSKRAATDKTLTAGDGLHPSASMYALWVKLIAPVVEAQIK